MILSIVTCVQTAEYTLFPFSRHDSVYYDSSFPQRCCCVFDVTPSSEPLIPRPKESKREHEREHERESKREREHKQEEIKTESEEKMQRDHRGERRSERGDGRGRLGLPPPHTHRSLGVAYYVYLRWPIRTLRRTDNGLEYEADEKKSKTVSSAAVKTEETDPKEDEESPEEARSATKSRSLLATMTPPAESCAGSSSSDLHPGPPPYDIATAAC